MHRLLSILLLCASLALTAKGAGPHLPVALSEMDMKAWEDLLAAPDSAQAKGENTRLVSAALTVLLGPFGAHRLYLGTTPKVAVVYGITFGGFGLLALLDLGHILFTKDLAPYRNNDRVFMWSGDGPAPELTPP